MWSVVSKLFKRNCNHDFEEVNQIDAATFIRKVASMIEVTPSDDAVGRLKDKLYTSVSGMMWGDLIRRSVCLKCGELRYTPNRRTVDPPDLKEKVIELIREEQTALQRKALALKLLDEGNHST